MIQRDKKKTIVKLEGVAFRYSNKSRLLFSDFNMTIGQSEIVALRGTNGVGKSTVCRIITGDLKPTQGTVRFCGQNPRTLERFPEMAVVSEPLDRETGTFPADLPAWDILKWGYFLNGVDPNAVVEQTESLRLTKADLNRPIRSFSKGERQRFNIAVCLARRPKFILADEPLEGVDVESRATICERFYQFVRRDGGAMLWISHYLDDALPLADRCYAFCDGRVEEERISSYEIDVLSDERVVETHSIVTLAQAGGVLTKLLRNQKETRLVVRDAKYRDFA